MTSFFDPRNRNIHALLLLSLVAGVTLYVTFLVIGRDMTMVMKGIGLVVLFFICFSSVRMSLVILMLSMILSPEILLGATERREVTLRLEDIVLFVLTLSWMFRMAILKDIGFMLKTPLNKSMAAFSIVAVIATSIGVWRGDVPFASGFFFTLKLLEYFVLYNVVVNNVKTEKEISSLLTLLILVMGVAGVVGLFQASSGAPIEAPFEGGTGERNTLGGYLVLMMSVCGGLLLSKISAGEKRMIGAIMSVSCITLALSLSRSGWLACILATTVLLLSNRRINVFLILACLMLVGAPLFVPEAVQDRLLYTFNQPTEAGQIHLLGIHLDTSTSARITSAIRVGNNFLNHAFFGYGITGYSFVDGQYVRTLIETGLLGLLAFGWLMVEVLKTIRKAKSTDLPPRLQGMVIGFHAGFWGLLAHAWTANTFYIVRIAEPFWCLAGLTVVCLNLAQEKAAEQTEELDRLPQLTRQRALWPQVP